MPAVSLRTAPGAAWLADMGVTCQVLIGDAVGHSLAVLARLRIDIFRDYPYLYAGRIDDELTYLRIYAATPGAVVVLAQEGDAIVGAATGIPLAAESPEFCGPFVQAGWPLAQIYYVGEILLYPSYRSVGAGSRLLGEVEDHARRLGFRFLASATVDRPVDHPLRPSDFIPIDRFCDRHGFVPHPELTVRLAWPDVAGDVMENTMTFRVKELAA